MSKGRSRNTYRAPAEFDVEPGTQHVKLEMPGPPEPPPEPPADEETLKAALLAFKRKPEHVLKARACMERDLSWLNRPPDASGRQPVLTMEDLDGGIRIELNIGRTLFYLKEPVWLCYWCGYDNSNNPTGKKVQAFVYKGASDKDLHPPRCGACPTCGKTIIEGKEDWHRLIDGKDKVLNKTLIREAQRGGRPSHVSPTAGNEE